MGFLILGINKGYLKIIESGFKVEVLRKSTVSSSGPVIFETPDFLAYAKSAFPSGVGTAAMTMAPPILTL